MLTEERMQELAEQFEERFSRVCLRILQDIGETLKKTGDLTPSQAKKLQQMFTYGADVERMTKMLAQASGASMEEIQKLYEQVAKEEQDWSEPFYDAKEITQIPFAENDLLQNIVKAAAAVTRGELRNMSRTTTVGIKTKNGFQPLGSFYKKTVDDAISAVATGTLDYNSAVRQAIKDMGSSGLRVQYESGYTRRLDSAIRQNIIDGVSYIAQETAKQAGEEFGADGVELSAHSPSAPDHLPYQGKQYSLKKYEELQATLKRPIGEWNCRHFPYPILLGISRPANSKAELAEMERESNRKIEIDGKEYTRYECTQMQRKLETKLRYAREEKAIYQAAGQDDLVREATEKMRILGNKYKEVSEKAGLPTRAERMRVFASRKAKDVVKGRETGIMKENTTKATDGMTDLIQLGKINIGVLEEEFGKILTDDIVVTSERIEHIKDHHPEDYALFEQYGKAAVKDPDVIIRDKKHEGTVFMVKKMTETNLNVVVRVVLETDDPEYKNSVMTFYRLRDKNLKKLAEKNGVIYKKE